MFYQNLEILKVHVDDDSLPVQRKFHTTNGAWPQCLSVYFCLPFITVVYDVGWTITIHIYAVEGRTTRVHPWMNELFFVSAIAEVKSAT